MWIVCSHGSLLGPAIGLLALLQVAKWAAFMEGYIASPWLAAAPSLAAIALLGGALGWAYFSRNVQLDRRQRAMAVSYAVSLLAALLAVCLGCVRASQGTQPSVPATIVAVCASASVLCFAAPALASMQWALEEVARSGFVLDSPPGSGGLEHWGLFGHVRVRRRE